MNSSDYIGAAFFLAWGLWWIAFPASVGGVYRRLHRGRLRGATSAQIRVAGCLWLLLVGAVLFHALGMRK